MIRGCLRSVIFTLACSFRLLLPSDAGLLVVLSFTNLLLYAGFCAVSLKAP